MLKRSKESDTYLVTFCRYHWSAQVTMKKDNLFELRRILRLQLIKATVLAESSNKLSFFSLSSVHSSDVYGK
jgi:hypothetical protein